MRPRILFIAALAVMSFLPSASVLSQGADAGRASLSVVDIQTDKDLSWDGSFSLGFLERLLFDFFEKNRGFSRGNRCRTEGAGVIFDAAGLVLTNAHVVAGADHVFIVFSDKRVLRATVLGRNKREDLAVLKIESPVPAGLVPVKFGDSEALTPGEKVFAVGNPYGYSRSVSGGVVSALHRPFTAAGGVSMRDLIQTDAPVNPGNSGGPLMNEKGEMVGLVTLRDWRAEGINFAIPVNRIKMLLQELMTLDGARAQAAEFQKRFGLQLAEQKDPGGDRHLVVENAMTRSAAKKAGVRTGDILTVFGKTGVSDWEDLVAVFPKVASGKRVYLQFRRGDRDFFTYVEAP